MTWPSFEAGRTLDVDLTTSSACVNLAWNLIDWSLLPVRAPVRKQTTQIKIKSNQIKSNQIKSNQIKSNQIKSNQIKSNNIFKIKKGECQVRLGRRENRICRYSFAKPAALRVECCVYLSVLVFVDHGI